MNKLPAWLDSEPVRTRLYPIVALVAAYLLTKAGIQQDASDLVMGILSLLFGTAATESARSLVSPTSHGD